MAHTEASHERLAALTSARRTASPEPSDDRAPVAEPGDGPDPGEPSGLGEVPEASGDLGPGDVPDPRFWGPEPRRVRRAPGSRAADRDRLPARESRWWAAAGARLRDARVEAGIGVLALVLVVTAAGVVWYRMASGGGAPVAGEGAGVTASGGAPSSGPGAADGAAGGSGDASGSESTGVDPARGRGTGREAALVVHVAGAVNLPGVLLMPAGARVIDAVEGAGGALPDADLDRLNLAAPLADGQRVLVPRIGAPSPDGPPAGGESTGELVDLNIATSAQLEALPGIGPALAGAIIAERERRGGFRSVNELREVRGIGDARFAELRDRVTV